MYMSLPVESEPSPGPRLLGQGPNWAQDGPHVSGSVGLLGGTLTSFLFLLCICWVPVQILYKNVRFKLFKVFFGSSTQNHAESFGNHPRKSSLDPKHIKLPKKCKSTCKNSIKVNGNRPVTKKNFSFSGMIKTERNQAVSLRPGSQTPGTGPNFDLRCTQGAFIFSDSN